MANLVAGGIAPPAPTPPGYRIIGADLKEYGPVSAEQLRESGKEDANALLSEAARLEFKGDTAGALAKYEAVRQRFRGTEAARDAEASIRSLKGKVG